MNTQEQAEQIVKKMMAEDAFSQWLGIEILTIKPGYSKIRMDIKPNMNNGFSITHGGITHSLADSALAFASNNRGRVAVAMETNISYTKKVNAGDTLTAETEELNIGNRIGVYNVEIANQKHEKVALFRGTVYRTKKQHFNHSCEF